jgi:hypothetical protein
MQEGLRRIYPRKEGKGKREKAREFCAGVFGGELIRMECKARVKREND